MVMHKILFIGLGGAGQRHLRVFHRLLDDRKKFSTYRHSGSTPLLNPDFTVNESDTLKDLYGLIEFESLEDAFADKPDLTVISSPTSSHRGLMMKALQAGSAVFVEKPWAENLLEFDVFEAEVINRKLPFLISFQRRYHPQLLKVKELISRGTIGKIICASFEIFSDVRKWHTYEDWKKLYAVRSDLGGGVLLTEIHEIDLIYWYFGVPKSVFCYGGIFGAEVIDVEDSAQMILSYPTFSITVSLCFMYSIPSRTFKIYGSEGEISWDEDGAVLKTVLASGQSEFLVNSLYKSEDSFISQANYFLKNWTQSDTNNALLAARTSLAIIEAAKKSLITGRSEPVNHF